MDFNINNNCCFICHSKIDHKKGEIDSLSVSKILCDLYNLPTKVEGDEDEDKGHSCKKCYNLLTNAKKLIKEFLIITQKLNEIKIKIKELIIDETNEEEKSNNLYLQSILNSIRRIELPNNEKIEVFPPKALPDDDDINEDEDEETDFEEELADMKMLDNNIEWEDEFNPLLSFSDEEDLEENNIKEDLPFKTEIKEAQTSSRNIGEEDTNKTNKLLIRKRGRPKKPIIKTEDSESEWTNDESNEEDDNDDDDNSFVLSPTKKSQKDNTINTSICSNAKKSKDLENQNKSSQSESSGPVKCEICQMSFPHSGKAYLTHMLKVHGKKALKCTEEGCNWSFSRIDHLTRHIGRIHKRELLRFKCKFCDDVAYYKQYELKIHLKNKHKVFYKKNSGQFEDVKFSYSCEFCPLKFRGKLDFNTHLYQKHGIKANQCTEENCTLSFVNSKSLEKHIASVHRKDLLKIQCDRCSSLFFSQWHFNRHFKRNHTNQIFECPDPGCKRKYKDEYDYKRHIKIHEAGYTPIICDECGVSTLDLKSLNAHMRTIHSKVKRFKCSHCPFVASQIAKFRRHTASHTDLRLFVCSTCKNTFKTIQDLRIHCKRHERENSYKCEFEGCKKTFSCQAYLTKHKIRHEAINQWPFECKFCQKKFVSKYKKDAHETLHGGEKKYKCDKCHIMKTHPYYLTIHKSTVHKIKS